MSLGSDPYGPLGAGQPNPGPKRPDGKAAARWALAGVMLTLIVGAAFGLGFATRWLMAEQAGPATASAALRSDGAPDFRVLDDMYKVLRDNFVDPSKIDAELIRTGAINGVLNAVGDTHQAYITKESYETDTQDDLKGKFSGIGASVDQRNGEITIVRPFDGSPAMRAGVRAGDVLLAIDGEATTGIDQREAVRKIRGPNGTKVRLTVRHTDGKTEELTITREDIKLPSVRPDIAQDANGNPVEDLGYVRIEQFTERTPEELRDYLRSIQDKNYKGLILDLRNNPGGLLDSVVKVAEQFMKNQVVLIETRRDGNEKKWTTSDKGIATEMKLAVLVNKNSASASELLAGALRDNGRGTVLGESTFGKGTVNTFFDLPSDGGKLYVSIGRWYTPKRTGIEGTGIKPDIEVKVAANENALDYFNSVMYRAVDLLRSGG